MKMTKHQVLKEMLETSRCLVDPKQAEKWVKAFGTSLKELGLVSRKTKDFYRANPYSISDAEALSIATYMVAGALVEKTTKERAPRSPLHGAGSSAEWITEKSVEILRAI